MECMLNTISGPKFLHALFRMEHEGIILLDASGETS